MMGISSRLLSARGFIEYMVLPVGLQSLMVMVMGGYVQSMYVHTEESEQSDTKCLEAEILR